MVGRGAWFRPLALAAFLAAWLTQGLVLTVPVLAIAPSGSFVQVLGSPAIYAVIGGAAVRVDSCAPLGGCAGLQRIASLAGYAKVPANGSFVRIQNGPAAGFIGVLIGGSVIHVDSCVPLNGCAGLVGLDSGGAAAYLAAHLTPANGSFVRVADGPEAGLFARAAGGDLIGLTDCAPLAGCPGAVALDAGGFADFSQLHPTPADGTLLLGLPSQTTWLVLAGQREPAAPNPAAVSVNDASLTSIPVASSGGTGTTTDTPRTAPRRRRHRRLRVKVALAWEWNLRRTQLQRLELGRHSRHVRISVACRGQGCPQGTRSAGAHKLARLQRALDGRVYHAGDRLTITLSARGFDRERVEVVIRDGRIPKIRLL